LLINPSIYRKLPYDADKDFAPVSAGVISPLVFVVHPSVPARTLAELVALARKTPGTLTYGSAGQTSATALGVRILEHITGVQFNQIPYKGLGQAYQNLLSAELTFMLSDFPVSVPHIKTGKLIPLAATHRTKILPDVPTAAEAGFPIGEVSASFMVAAPAGVPQPVVQKLNGEINRLMRQASIAEKLDSHVLIPVFGTADEFATRLRQQREMWATMIRKIGIQPE
jgi:tripartite-type tricarboxylate transporter receptor subunit TctC